MTSRPARGFSLLELSVVLVIISLIVAFGFNAGQNAVQGADRVTTQERLQTIKLALDNYAAMNGFLPCPSQRVLTPSSASFGVESRPAPPATSCTVAGDIKSLPPSPGTPIIYLGGVPVRTLGLPDAYAADAWNDKFLYAVSMNHVGSVDAYRAYDGPITIKTGDRTGTNMAITTTRCPTGKNCTPGIGATYVVVSHGPDGKGAYPLYGTALATPCGTTAAIDVANCDETNATNTADISYFGIFYSTLFNDSLVVPSKFFDDYIVWGSNATYRSPMIAPPGMCQGTLIAGGSNTCSSAMTDCPTSCLSAGFSSGGLVANNCSGNSLCSSSGSSCDYQCCCTGTPSSGYCPPVSGQIWSTNCTADIPTGAATTSVTIYNTAAGYNGSATFKCNASGTAWVLQPGSTCSAGTPSAGCTGGVCQAWCAPCANPNNGYSTICEREIILNNPCTARCVYAGCPGNGKPCMQCP